MFWFPNHVFLQTMIKPFTTILPKMSAYVNRYECICKQMYLQFLKSKIKSYGDKATDFYGKEIPKVASIYNWLGVILINFIFKKAKYYYLCF